MDITVFKDTHTDEVGLEFGSEKGLTRVQLDLSTKDAKRLARKIKEAVK